MHMEVINIAAGTAERYSDARLELEYNRNVVVLDQRSVRLTKMEFLLLSMLAQNAGEIVPRAALLAQVWGYSPEVHTRTLDVHIRRLRGKLGDYSRRQIETIFGIGYRLQPAHRAACVSGAA
jgi:DNA-binding response OmpR family regulator